MDSIPVDLHGAGLAGAPLYLGGVFHVEHVRDGVVIDTWQHGNVVTDEGINHSLNVIFNGATQVATWCIGLFVGNYTPIAADTAATFPSTATEATTQYTEGARQTYVEATSTAKSITNSASKATFTCGTAMTVYGAFLSSVSTRGGTSGVLMAAAKFSSAKTLEVNDQLLVTYTINGSSL